MLSCMNSSRSSKAFTTTIMSSAKPNIVGKLIRVSAVSGFAYRAQLSLKPNQQPEYNVGLISGIPALLLCFFCEIAPHSWNAHFFLEANFYDEKG